MKHSIFRQDTGCFSCFYLGATSVLRAAETNNYGVAGGYEAYSVKKDLYERGPKLLTGNEMIYIQGNRSAGNYRKLNNCLLF